MRTTMTVLVACVALAAAGACSKKKPAPTEGSGSTTGSNTAGSDTAGSGSGTAGSGSGEGSNAMAGSGSDMAGSGSGGEQSMQHMAGNCPSTVLGSASKVEVKGKNVVLTISATDKDAIAAIQKRTAALIKDKAAAKTGGAEHDQKGSQGGGKGLCPVFWEDGGKATAKNDAKGATITITPKDKPDDLKATIEDRIKKSDEWVKDHIKEGDKGNQGGVGGGGGEHGSTHSGSGDGKGKERKGSDGKGGGGGTGGGGGKGTGGGDGGGKGSGGGGW